VPKELPPQVLMMLEKSDAVEGAEQGRIVVYVQQLSKNYYKSASNKTLTKFMHLSVAVKCWGAQHHDRPATLIRRMIELESPF
jgi:hypothetical protein